MSEGEFRDHVRRILLQKGKVEAIKSVRERTGWELRKAKDYVDAVERGEPSPPAAPEPISDDEIRALIREGSYVSAVKRVRETTGRGLKEAKDYVDAVASAMGRQMGSVQRSPAVAPQVPMSRIGPLSSGRRKKRNR
jgi:ribosomal protein L7/L12